MLEATKAAGAIAKSFQEKGFKQLEMKDKGDPFLTEADIAIDTHLRETLTKAFPEYGWYSEETPPTENPLEKEFCFVVDPIDGTRDFVERNGEFSISVGLIHKGKPVVGFVYAPMKDRMISGAQGTGVLLNGEVVKPSASAELKNADVIVSRSETRKGLWTPYENSFKTRVVGSAAHKIAAVAAGLADANPSLRPKNLWDVCAGHFLILEAGGQFTQLDGSDIEYADVNFRLNNYLATSQESIHQALLTQLGHPYGSR